jgi:pullulanase/glycogen debranching enzyme
VRLEAPVLEVAFAVNLDVVPGELLTEPVEAGSGDHLHVMLNAYWEPLTFELPPLPNGQRWHRVVDTALPSPGDFCEPESAPPAQENTCRVEARSAVVLMAHKTSEVPETSEAYKELL